MPLVPGGGGLGCAADTRALLCTVQAACAFSLAAGDEQTEALKAAVMMG